MSSAISLTLPTLQQNFLYIFVFNDTLTVYGRKLRYEDLKKSSDA